MSNSDQSHEHHADGIVEAGQKAPSYFYLLYFGLIAWGIIFIAYYLLSGWSSSSEFEEKMTAHTATYNQSAIADTTAPAVQSGPIDVAALFANNCAGCHGADGKGGFGSDLSSPAYKYGKGVESVRSSITNGRGGRMPPFSGQLSTADIDALADFSINL